ncbi:hypothetical protein HY745_05230 [Candidatus Desantisbacteria bacterium]|nr:hypothetical protein [Candidatus Desantisbacteria bacterium]
MDTKPQRHRGTENKIIFIILLIILLINTMLLASDDIFDEIGNELGKKETAKEDKPYFINLFDAIKNKESYILYKEIYSSNRYSSQLKEAEGRNSLGFILFGTFSGPRGQIGDMNVQFRAAYYNNQFAYGEKMPREYTDNLNQAVIELHNAYLRFRTGIPMITVRLGHFYIPYGIQPWIDTHGSFLQSPTMEFTGLDRDWGTAIEGQNDILEYQLGLTRGSGMEYFEKNDNFTVAGKLSTPRIGEHLNEWLGISFLTGRIFDPMGVEKLRSYDMDDKEELFTGSIIERWRTGIDGQKIFGPLRLRGEISTGKDASKENVLGEFAELKYALDSKGHWSTYLQYENLTQALNSNLNDSNTTGRFGLSYSFSANYNIQFVVSKDFNTIFGKKDTWIGIMFYGQKGGGWLEW